MQVRSSFDFDGELRRIALTRVLDFAPVTLLGDRALRHQAYAVEGLGPVSIPEDADAIRRSLLFRAYVAPRSTGVAA